jgi:hypothetical protein
MGLHQTLNTVFWPQGKPQSRVAVMGGAMHFTMDDGKNIENAIEEWLRRFTEDPSVLPESCTDPNAVGACIILRELDLVFVASQLVCYSGTMAAVCTAADFVLRHRNNKRDLLLVELKLASEARWKASDPGSLMQAPFQELPVSYENMAYVQAAITCEVMKSEYKRKCVSPVVLCVHAPLIASLRNVPEHINDLASEAIHQIAKAVGMGHLRSGSGPRVRLEIDQSLLTKARQPKAGTAIAAAGVAAAAAAAAVPTPTSWKFKAAWSSDLPSPTPAPPAPPPPPSAAAAASAAASASSLLVKRKEAPLNLSRDRKRVYVVSSDSDATEEIEGI